MFERFLHLALTQKIASLATLCTFTATMLIVLASYQGSHHIIQQSTQLIGSSLSEQLAQEASNALVKNDKLSLQSQLNKSVQNPLITHGAIYDVNNKPVAEAGDPKRIDGETYSSSISFQDSLAGYAVVTIKATPLIKRANSLALQYIFLSILISATVFWLTARVSQYISEAIRDLTILAKTPLKKRNPNTRIVYRGQDELLSLAEALLDISNDEDSIHQNSTTSTNQYTILVISIKNLDSLYKQRSPLQIDRFIESLYQHLLTICKLYEGNIEHIQPNSFAITFYKIDDDNYPFRALCSSQLIKDIINQQKYPLDISIGLSLIQNNPNEKELKKHLKKYQAFQSTKDISLAKIDKASEPTIEKNRNILILVTSEIKNHSSINSRAHFESYEQNTFLLTSFEQNYRTLLQKQLATLNTKKANH